jgi:hypothetical protein
MKGSLPESGCEVALIRRLKLRTRLQPESLPLLEVLRPTRSIARMQSSRYRCTWFDEPNAYVVRLEDHRDAVYDDALASVIRKRRRTQTRAGAAAAHPTAAPLLACGALVA